MKQDKRMGTAMSEPRWRLGNHVHRNVYFDGEPAAMVAGSKEEAERIAAFIVRACNEQEERDSG